MRKPRVDPIVPHIGARFKTVLQVDHVCSGQQVAECLANVLARVPQAARRHEVMCESAFAAYRFCPILSVSANPLVCSRLKKDAASTSSETICCSVTSDHATTWGKMMFAKPMPSSTRRVFSRRASLPGRLITATGISHILLHAASHGPPPLGAPREVPSWWASQS